MAQTTAGSLQGDVLAYLAEEVLPIAQRRLVIHQFGERKRIPKGRGNTWSATRYQRLPLPYAPIAEGVPPTSQQLTIQQVIGTAQQWAGLVVITDVAELTIFHDPFQQAKRMLGYQVGECLERNDFLVLMGTTQVNYPNLRGSRANLVAGDVLDPYTIIRTQAALDDIGAPYYDASTEPQIRENIREGGAGASGNPRSHEHYVAVGRGLALADLRQNPTIVNAWSYSDINRLYNNEVGEWSSIRFCRTNMSPSFLGAANTAFTVGAATGTGSGFAAGTYFIIVTGSDSQNQYESYICAVSAGTAATAGQNIPVTTPNVAGYTWNIYVGLTSSPQTLGLSPSGPTSGSMAGQAVQIPSNTTVNLTGIGLPQVPPAAPAVGVTVHVTFVFGQGAFAVVELENIEYSYLNSAEKIDPVNQLRVAGWKAFLGAMILNSNFVARIESASAFSATFG